MIKVEVSLDLFYFLVEQTAKNRIEKIWAHNPTISDALYEELVERLLMSLGRVKNYVSIAKEFQKSGKPGINFFLEIFEKEFGYDGKSMNFPDLKTWWPIGLSHGIDDIFTKHNRAWFKETYGW